MHQYAVAALNSTRGRFFVVFGLLLLVVGPWILATPPSAGPDEPGHNVRAAAIVRGEMRGVEFFEGPNRRGYELPAYIGLPDPGCFAFDSTQPASCVSDEPPPEGTVIRGTRSSDYPVWGFVLPGLGSFGPASAVPFASRALDALIPIALLALSMTVASRRSSLAAGAVLLATTPMVMFSIAVVNPSGLTIAGGVALWTALYAYEPRRPMGRAAGALLAFGWVALVLPRRDGLIWGALILSIAALIVGVQLEHLWRALSRWNQGVIAAATLAVLAWAGTSQLTGSKLLFAMPVLVAASMFGRAGWRRASGSGRAAQIALLGVGTGVVLVGFFGVMSRRATGFSTAPLAAIVAETGTHLTQAIGSLGWLDTPVPTTMVMLWLLGLGALFGAATNAGRSDVLLVAAATLVVAVGTSWALAVAQSDRLGVTWQGRYYLPLLLGIPIALGHSASPSAETRRLGLGLTAVALVVLNVSLGALMRRFGVGTGGVLVPWRWDTYEAPVPLTALLFTHAIASFALFIWIWRLWPGVTPASVSGGVSERSVADA